MWPSGSRLGLLGNPENRRLQHFSQAVTELGGPLPQLLSYRELLENPKAPQCYDVDLWRIDSPGENDEVHRALIALGGARQLGQLEFGQIGFGSEFHRGFGLVLDSMKGLPCLSDPAEILVMFDKWESHQRFLQHGVSRPPSELAPASFAEFRRRLEQGSGRLFLKPLHGSSASGVCALRWSPGRRQLLAPIRIVDGKLFNSLKVRSYHSCDEIETILGQLLPQGMIAERWIPKLTLAGGAVDLRVLVISGVARHRVVRQSLSPMTNLHLGNRRGDEDALRRFLGERRFSEALELAEKAAACFPQSLYAGVDILLDLRGRAYVGEINAFGDLLPGLFHRGQSAYTAIAEACCVRRRSV